ncbi:MAG: hypothetical protein V2B14_02395 [bacterium]
MLTIKPYNSVSNYSNYSKNLKFQGYRRLDPIVAVSVLDGKDRQAALNRVMDEYGSFSQSNLVGNSFSKLPGLFAARITSLAKQIFPGSNIQVNPEDIERDAIKTRRFFNVIA